MLKSKKFILLLNFIKASCETNIKLTKNFIIFILTKHLNT